MGRARFLISNICEDACGTLKTDRSVEGAPVYRCPGCDSEWIELAERTRPVQSAGPTNPPPATSSVHGPSLDVDSADG